MDKFQKSRLKEKQMDELEERTELAYQKAREFYQKFLKFCEENNVKADAWWEEDDKEYLTDCGPSFIGDGFSLDIKDQKMLRVLDPIDVDSEDSRSFGWLD